MAATNLYHYDVKGNTVKVINTIIADIGETPTGIETDHEGLMISTGDLATFLSGHVYWVDKKGNQRRNFANNSANGVTTDRKNVLVPSFNGGTGSIRVYDKKGNLVNTIGPNKAYRGMCHNGVYTLATILSTATFDVIDPKGNVIKTVTCTGSTALTGICSVGKHVAVIDANRYIKTYDYLGNLIATLDITAGAVGSVITDLTFDGKDFWIVHFAFVV